MSFLDKPTQPVVFRPPAALKRSAVPQRVPAAAFHHDGRPMALAPIAPLGAAPLGLSPGLGPSNPALLVMPIAVADTPMSIPIVKDRPAVSDESVRSRMYSRDEFMALRGECCHTPSAILEWCLGMYRIDGGVGGLRCPPHLRLLVDELEADRHGAMLGGVGRKTARPVRAVHHKVMSVLSRLTPQKYEPLREELFQLPLRQLTDSELRDVVKVFFNKAVQEHRFSDLYARLVADICTMTEAESALDGATRERLLQSRMRSELLTACQEEFNRPLQLTEKDRVDPITGEALPEEEVERKRETLKARLVGNIKFVGELYKYHLVNPRVISSIFSILVFDFDPEEPRAKEEYLFEVFAMLLKTVGSRVSREDPAVIEGVMRVVTTIGESNVANRVRFSMMDLNDLHKQGWPSKKSVLTQQEQEHALQERAARENAQMDRQKAALRSEAAGHRGHHHAPPPPHHHHSHPASPNASTSDGIGANKFVPPFSKRGGLASATATPVNGGRSFPASMSSSTYSTPLAAGRKGPPAAPHSAASTPTAAPPAPPAAATTTTTTTTTRTAPGSVVPPPPPAAALAAAAASANASLNASRASMPSSPLKAHPSTAAGASAAAPAAAPLIGAAAIANPRATAQQLIKAFNGGEAGRTSVLQRLAGLERVDCITILTSWLRECVLVTANFDARDNLPLLFLGIVERCEDPNGMILSSSDLLTTVLEWLRLDISQSRFSECPRFFANWSSVVQRAAKLATTTTAGAGAGAPPQSRTHWIRVLSILSCSTFTVCLREIAINERREAIVTAIRDMNAAAQQVTAACDSLAGRDPQKVLHFAASCRFRLLPYIIKADDGDKIRIPHTPSLGPAPTAPIGCGPSDPYHQCFQIQADDAEMNLFKRVLRREGFDSAINSLKQVQSGSNVTRLVTVMKITAATLSLLNPPTGEKPLMSEEDGARLLREIVDRCPSDMRAIAQASIVLEMICFFLSNTNKLLGIGGTPILSSSGAPSSPGKARREDSTVALAATADTFRRWCDSGVVDRTSVLSTLQSVAPIAVPSTPGTPPRMSSTSLDVLDSSFSLPEPAAAQRAVSSPLMGASASSCPSTPQMGSSVSGGRHTSAAFKFDMCEMLVRNMNFVSHLKWAHVLNQLQK